MNRVRVIGAIVAVYGLGTAAEIAAHQPWGPGVIGLLWPKHSVITNCACEPTMV